MERWLLLTDYASKYRISVSTLRRRIKAGAQRYRFEAGKYYLPDEAIPASTSDLAERPFDRTSERAPEMRPRNESAPSPLPAPAVSEARAALPPIATEEPLITTTSKLLNELKQAYTLILHEKEEQIIHLKDEISDLKTLVRVLESENLRLNDQLGDDVRHRGSSRQQMDV